MGNKHGKSNTYVVSGSGRAGHTGHSGHRTAEDRGRRHSGQSDTSVTPSDDINYSGVDPSSPLPWSQPARQNIVFENILSDIK